MIGLAHLYTGHSCHLPAVWLCGSVMLCGSVWLSPGVVVWQAAEPAPVSPMLAVAHQALARHGGQVGRLVVQAHCVKLL